MKSSRLSLLSVGVITTCLFSIHNADAATIIWAPTATSVSADTDISTNGTSVFAYSLGGSGTAIINTVAFVGIDTFDAVVDPGLTFTVGGNQGSNGTAFANGGNSNFTALSAEYQGILAGANFGNAQNATVNLTGLVLNQQYEIQFFSNDSRGRGDINARITTIQGTGIQVDYNDVDGNSQLGVGQFITGTFTADALTQDFVLEGASSQQINAIQLRAIPEPSSLSLLGLVGVGLLLRRRKNS